MNHSEFMKRREEARAWVHGAIAAECHWSAAAGWMHSKHCNNLVETRMVAIDRDETASGLRTLLNALEHYLDHQDDDAAFSTLQRAMEAGAVELAYVESRVA